MDIINTIHNLDIFNKVFNIINMIVNQFHNNLLDKYMYFLIKSQYYQNMINNRLYYFLNYMLNNLNDILIKYFKLICIQIYKNNKYNI